VKALTIIKKIALLSLSLLVLFSLPVQARTNEPLGQDIRFTHLSLEDGLSQTSVMSILQDSHGFMWFGTHDGLNRYDGYNFVVYRDDPTDHDSLGGNIIHKIIEDPSGILWIGTQSGGLIKFDPMSETFTRYRHDPDKPNSPKKNSVWSLWQDESGFIWLGTGDGWLSQFDPIHETFSHYQTSSDGPSGSIENSVTVVIQDKSGTLWLGSQDGLASFDPGTGQFTHFQHNPDVATSISAGAVTDIFEDMAGRLWIATALSGINLLDRQSGQFKRFQHDPDDPYSISNDECAQIFQDSRGIYWVATDKGLNQFDPLSGQFIRYRENPSNPHALSDDSIRVIYEDRGGVLWFGTSAAGLNKFEPRTRQFIHYKNLPDNPNSLSSNYIYSIYEDKKGILWVGGDDGVLNRFDRANNQVTRYEPDADNPRALNVSESVSSIYENSSGALWIGTYQGGLHRFNRETGLFQRYLHNPADPGSLSSNIILTIHEDSTGGLWIGTGTGGLNRYDSQTERFQRYQLGHGWIRGIFEDQSGLLWLTTANEGLTRFNPQTGQFRNYLYNPADTQSLASDVTYTVHEDQRGVLWIATGAGLEKFDRETEIFRHYTIKEGLPNNVIYAILEDRLGNLWLSTNKGVSRFDPRTETFQNYTIDDGLQGNEFNQNAFFQSESSEMFFGGINGLNAFYPENIINNPYVPPVLLTDFQLFNKSVTPAEDSILQKPIWATEHISLRYDQYVFSFEFTALSYAAPEDNRYRYKLEGLENNWNEVAAKRRFATYTSLPPGDYLFRVQGSNDDGVWNEQGASIKITITPPWWLTWWFRLLVALLVIGLIIGAFFGQRRNAIRREHILQAQVAERTHELNTARDDAITARKDAEAAKEKAETANLAKSTFLANMSHELRTPLNAVLGFSEMLGRDSAASTSQKEKTGIINRSGQHLLGLINSVLDMSKIEAGHTELEPEPGDLHRLLEDLGNMFRLRAETKDLEFNLQLQADLPQFVLLDMGKLEQVLINLLGNAINFTELGAVTLRADAKALSDNNWQLHFDVEDTGIGIPADKIDTIFEPFTQAGHSPAKQQGTGLGLAISRQFIQLMGGDITVESTEGEGSLFRFELQAKTTDEAPSTLTKQRVISLAADEPEWRILIVDDVDDNRLLLRSLLESVGFTVREAVNGEEGIQQFQDWHPQLIWMDMRMPVMDGYEATRRIRELPGGKEIKILALTASAFKEQEGKILAVGCDAVLHKPYHEHDIFTAMGEQLELQYVYEETTETLSKQAVSKLVLEDLQGLPDEWLEQFLTTTRLGDTEAMLALTKTLPASESETKAKLDRYINNFQLESLIKVFEKLN
jgi:signal transduction histidine kinase/ligand-binding sensor domain-containing protein/DNA-binding NarL/FixJ family response regulator